MAKEKKKKKNKVIEIKDKLTTPKKMAFFSMIVTLISFLYKIGLGIYSMSIILMVASISTFLVLVCKFVFYKRMMGDRKQKKFAYLIMMVSALAFAVLFLLFAVLKVEDIDIHKENNYTGWLSYVFMGFIIVMFVLSVIKLRGALQKNDIMVIGLKEMIFLSALTDAVIIEEFLYKTVIIPLHLDALDLPFFPVLKYTNAYFPLITAVIMLIIPLVMFNRYRKYEA